MAPTYQTLIKVKKELQSNAQSVGCSLGGRAHGHLSLVLKPEEYTTVSDTPYEEPQFPDPLVFACNKEAAVVTQEQADYFEAVRVFREAIDVKKTLINQIVASIDGM